MNIKLLACATLLFTTPAHAEVSWMGVQKCRANAIMHAPISQEMKAAQDCYKLAGKRGEQWRKEDQQNIGGVDPLDDKPIDTFRALRRGYEPPDRFGVRNPNRQGTPSPSHYETPESLPYE